MYRKGSLKTKENWILRLERDLSGKNEELNADWQGYMKLDKYIK